MKSSDDNRAGCRLLVVAVRDRPHGLAAQAEAIRRLLLHAREDEIEDGNGGPK